MMETNRKRSLEKNNEELEESDVNMSNADKKDEDDADDDRVEQENDGYQQEQSDEEESHTEEYYNEEDEPYPPNTPDESLANKLSFYQLCKTLEKIWNASHNTSTSSSLITKSKKTTQEEKLSKLLDPLQKYFARKEASTWFPILRLIVPNLDNTRGHLGLKETAIATAWIQALGLRKNNDSYNSIMYFTDPSTAVKPVSASLGGFVTTTDGDLSLRVQAVLAERIPSTQSSKSTIGKINQLLDELAAIKRSNHDMININAVGKTEADIVTKQEQDQKHDITLSYTPLPQQKEQKPPSKQELRKLWVQKLFDLQLSPLEHKWIIRIILQKMDLGIGWSSILRKVSELALDLHNANKNLKKLCACLADQEWIERYNARKLDLAKRVRNFRNDMIRMPCYLEEVQVGNVIRPMLSKRSSCPTALNDMERLNEEFVYLEKQERHLKSLLPIKFPTFIAEVKLDGERMIVHVQRGEVTMHTRQGNWYSRIYSPIIAPDIRKALADFDVDVILDGEMIAWDNIDKENIYFGKNKTVAKMRRKWCALNGLIDERDLNLHKEVENHSAQAAIEDKGHDHDNKPEAGADCWLKFVVFDILYVNGPDALRLLHCSNPYKNDDSFHPNEGSLIHLDGFYRKNILYNLLFPVENKVEIVQSLVVCSDGSCISGEKYFQKIDKESADQQHFVPDDSIVMISMACDDRITELVESDQKRRGNRTDQEIRSERAFGLGRFYTNIVENQGQEGIMVKNLNAPYMLGEASRSKGYWRKLKPDYDGSSQSHPINDLDCLVLGGYYASGLRDAGKINSFLLGCAESSASVDEGGKKFLTLGSVGKGITNQDYERLLDMTGFGKDNNSNKWFKSNGSLPDFVSNLSFQRSSKGDMDGWKFSKRKFPDLWIRPCDSFVLKILAADIVASDSYSAGVTFRFPRICGIRVDGFEGAGGKLPEEVESIDLFHGLYEDRMNQLNRCRDTKSTEDPHFLDQYADGYCPFLSEAGRKAKSYNRKTVRPAIAEGSKIPESVPVQDEALKGRSFCVLEGLDGSYRLNPSSLDAVEAKEEGWTEVFGVNSRDDVVTFILMHSGQCTLTVTSNTDYILGGMQSDPRVINYKNALQSENADLISKSSYLNKKRAKIANNISGVLKWFYVYRAVALWGKQMSKVKQEAVDDWENKSATYGLVKSSLTEPRSHDYLVQSKATEARFTTVEDQFRVPLWDELNMLGLKRSLLAVKESRQSESAIKNTEATIYFQNGFSLPLHRPSNFGHFEENDQWIQGGRRQLFCPFLLKYDESGTVCGGVRHSEGPAILYPDLFGNDFGLEKSEDASSAVGMRRVGDTDGLSLAALIPLVESMGAFVTPHLHEKVTHILCLLKHHDILFWEISLSSDVLEHQYLHEELKKRFRNTRQKIKLVSPRWVKNNWEKVHHT